MENIKQAIQNAQTALGIEFGSTRIKAVLIGKNHEPLASGSFDWENTYDNGIWTYPLEQVWEGLRGAFAKLKANVFEKYGVKLTNVGALGISGMMHGYLAFDKDGNQLAQFRTWRNTITAQAAEELSALFDFNIPQRWSIAHIYQAILNGEEHVKDVDFIATLAAYVHWKLTGNKVIGVGEASGMFPIDSNTNDYDKKMLAQFDEKIADKNFAWNIEGILPKVLVAGENAGVLTEEGALLLDPTGEFKAGVALCPPEGDAGTGMVATNSVAVRTGNVSAGTSIFLMVVLEKALSKLYPEIDMVTTPAGKPVAMVHCNNCSGEIDAWAGMFTSMCKALGMEISIYKVLDKMFESALAGDKDCGGLVAYNYLSGEVITGLDSGKPMFFRGPDSKFTLENFSRVQLCSAAATLSIGMEILADEDVKVDRILGHGGYFKAPVAGQKIMGAALEAPVSVMKTAGEGGPWGVAILAEYMVSKAEGEALDEYLENKVFAGQDSIEIAPDAEDIAGFKAFLENYKKGLAAEKAAVEAL